MSQGASEPGRPDGFLSEQIIGACIEISGTCLLESAYEECLCHEPSLRRVRFRRQVPVPVNYERSSALHEAQLLTCLELTGCQVGLLVDFNVPLSKQGLRRPTQKKFV